MANKMQIYKVKYTKLCTIKYIRKFNKKFFEIVYMINLKNINIWN